ncbi:MAG: hypothetical protein Wins2KO_16170 [Winogradskyella sp.]
MKKFFISVFVVAMSVITFSCESDSNDDDGNGSNEANLTVTIDGQQITFNSLIVETYSYDGFEEHSITATINNGTDRIITFYVYGGDLGADGLEDFDYTFNGFDYYQYGCQNTFDFTSIVTVNNGSRIEANFSGTLCGWDNATQQEVQVVLTNGTLVVDF